MEHYPGDEDTTDEIECPNCGTRVYYEVLSCPKCGLHFNVDELTGEDEPAVELAPSSAQGLSVAAVLTGWMASAALAFLINLLASRIWPGQTPALLGQVILFLAAPIGAFGGGYLAARVAQRREVQHGALVSLLSLVSAVLLEAYWHDLATESVRPAALASWALMMLTGPLGAWLCARSLAQARLIGLFGRLPDPRKKTLRQLDEKQLYFELLARVRHDIDVAERLIAYEARRKPRAGRAVWIQDAIERLDRDKR
jgi:putative membrane protein (TIGR04086 family)